MKKLFIVLAVVGLAAGAHGQATRFYDAQWGTPDAIDADLSDWPSDAFVVDSYGSNHGNNDTTTVPGAPDFSARWAMMHDADSLYLALEVTDDQRTQGAAAWGGDCVEIFFDVQDLDETSLANADQLRWYWNTSDGAVINEQGVGNGASANTAEMWTIEVEYAKSGDLTGEIDADGTFGFDIKIADNDDATDGADNRDENIFWGSEFTDAEHWNNPSTWGEIALQPEPSAPPAEVANAPVAPAPPTLDGVIDTDEWFGTWYDTWQWNFHPTDNTDFVGAPDFTARWQAMHDADNLYFAIEVEDDNRQTAGNVYERDGMEIYFDAANTKELDYNPGNVTIHYNGTEFETQRGTIGQTDDGSMYTIEFQIGKDDLDRSIPPLQNEIGFDIKMHDNDGNDPLRDVNAFWGSPDTERENWNNAQGWGTIILADNWIRSSVPASQIDAGTFLVLTGPEGSDYQWSYDGSELTGETGRTLTFNPVEVADAGDYQLAYNDGQNDLTTNVFVLTVLPEGSVPLASGLGLAALMGASALAGASILRRRKK